MQCLFEHPKSSKIEKLLIDLTKRGRAFGLHMIMSTQTLTGYTISSELLTQFKMRIAFTVNTSDSMKIFMIGNEAPVYLKPFQFILNDGMGVKENNQRILMNKPADDLMIQEVIEQYRGRDYECIVINTITRDDISMHSSLSDNSISSSISVLDDKNDVINFFNSEINKEKNDIFLKESESAENIPPVDTDWDKYFDKFR
ncbi:hypothetical protein [Glaesserella parasuis]|uniref:hypothetical protein n=1 Tax=Glaesserella parasuis TaxID=738 RepID=UPI003D0CEE75